jgi:hypothetical protein
MQYLTLKKPKRLWVLVFSDRTACSVWFLKLWSEMEGRHSYGDRCRGADEWCNKDRVKISSNKCDFDGLLINIF